MKMRIQTEKSVLQLCRLCKQREARLVSFGKCKFMSTDTESLCCRKKSEVRVTFFISDYVIQILCIEKQVFDVRNNRKLLEIKT